MPSGVYIRKHQLQDHLEENCDIDPVTGCWNWNRGGNNGYGVLNVNGKDAKAHRHYYTTLVGPIPEGFVVHHKCHNKLCVNPDHLETRTHKENVLEANGPTAINARKTHCIRGHELTEENTYTASGGGRACRQCALLRGWNWYRKLRGSDIERNREYKRIWARQYRAKNRERHNEYQRE